VIFADLFFVYGFLAAVAICYAVARVIDKRRAAASTARRVSNPDRHGAENVVLVIFSLIFYAWGEPVYVFLMVFCVLVNYVFGLFLSENKSRGILAAAVAFNVLVIGVFKYAGFFVQCLNVGLGALGVALPVPEIRLPIGISFFTFQSLSYVIDVYRDTSPVQRKPLNLLLYVSMFPQLIAGPIVRYDTIARQITSRTITVRDLSEGMFRFVVGFGKKVILADGMMEISEQFLQSDPATLSVFGAWLGILTYTLRIYLDFSAYSDMAIGMGRCFGFHFDENFNYPYTCTSITDFWRRWHISLGTFFRDYVYIPMGGNQRHQFLNIMVVWFLTGMWHGAAWNFILWGVYFGVILIIEKHTILKVAHRIPKAVRHLYSMILVVFGWVLFYFDSFEKIGAFTGALFGGGSGGLTDLLAGNAAASNLWLLLAAVIACLPVGRYLRYCYEGALRGNTKIAVGMTLGKIVAGVALLVCASILLVGNTSNAFLYTRF